MNAKKMRILFISSRNVIAADLARILKQEGNQVKLFIDDKDRKLNLDNIVEKTSDWRKELAWVGKDGLIVFDDVGYGKIQDDLRKKGYSVFGGCELGDELEVNREHAQNIFRQYDLQVLETFDFSNIDKCIEFIEKSKKIWVVKQNDHKLNINHISQLNDNQDIIEVLRSCKNKYSDKIKTITIQEKAIGVEIGVGRYFNGRDWVGPIEINFEHKHFFNGGIGPMTTEMGTLAWYDGDEKNILFQKTIAKLKPYLQEINFKGDFELNFIINKKGIFPLEATTRLGSPIVYLQCEFNISPWGEFIKAIADGKKFDLKWKKGFGIVVLLAVPPFPYVSKLDKISPEGTRIYFKNVREKDYKHIYFEGVAKMNLKNKLQYYISDGEGYILYITGIGKTVENARKKVYNLINKIYIPKMMYRSDIGSKFITKDLKSLNQWGYKI